MPIESSINKIAAEAIESQVFPGATVAFTRDGREAILPFGRLTYDDNDTAVSEDTLYDVASITKSVPTACLALKLVEEGRLRLDDRVVNYVPQLTGRFMDEMTVRHLLTYTAIADLEHGLSGPAREGIKALEAALYESDLKAPPGERYHYTNPPAVWLGMAVERVMDLPLDKAAEEELFGPLGLLRTTFDPGRFTKDEVAPSEIDWRGELRRIVHDESAWRLRQEGLVCGHAGLFTTAGDLLKFARMLLAGGTAGGRRYFKQETVELMHTNQLEDMGHEAALGWEMGSREVVGVECSDETFFKTGFTGCLVVVDPEKDAAMVLLSNSTFPHRPQSRDKINEVRRKLADLVFGN